MKETETYVDSILSGFQKMDIDYLRKNLKDDHCYQEAPKEIFLNEVEDIFKAHRTSGDNELYVFKGACQGEKCANCGKSGIRFMGNKSHNYFDLIFQIEEDDIKDIFTCSEFETEEYSGKLGIQASIYINEDDRVSFVKTAEYLSKLNNALSAFDELICKPTRIVTFEDCTYWVSKYAFLYESLGGRDIFAFPMKWSKFLNLYYVINEWSEFLNNSFRLIKNAVSELKEVSTEEETISWVIKYEDLFEKIPFDLKFGTTKDNGFFRTDSKFEMLLTGEVFDGLFMFIDQFFEHQNTLLEKFGSYTDEEAREIFNKYGSEDGVNLSSIKYHLERRAEAKLLGFEIPFYLNKKNNS